MRWVVVGWWWVLSGTHHTYMNVFSIVYYTYLIFVVSVVGFAGKVLYEIIEKNETYRKISKTVETHHNPPQEGRCQCLKA